MFNEFLKFFNERTTEYKKNSTPYLTFLDEMGGRQFGKGVFNTFSKDNVKKWTQIVGDGFPEFKEQFKLFGYDWLGRCFAIDLRDNQNEGVLMFEIGTNDVLEIPVGFNDFLNQELPMYSNECLATDFYEEWLQTNAMIKYGRCIGYKVPLFLGGEDTIDNLEDSDMEVYWYIISEIKNR